MADYRQIHTRIWKDAWFFELSSKEKLLFIYLFSNERANVTGLYDLHKRIISFETGLTPETIENGFKTFEKAGKVFYESGWVWIPNLLKYNTGSLKSEKIRIHINKFLEKTPNVPLKLRCIEYYNSMVEDEYRIDTPCIGYTTPSSEQEQEQEQEQEKTKGEKTSPVPSTFEQWQDGFQNAPNQPGYVGTMLQWLYPKYYKNKKPNYGMLASMLKKHDPDYMLLQIFNNSGRPPVGDPVKFIAGILGKKSANQKTPTAAQSAEMAKTAAMGQELIDRINNGE